ncbi:probable 39S ribosomal protein L45, mitochondrial [Sitodiplosis mosellana]|uniref:probable 39S ribosomal protein L45, mitochondrial n=1 Tax=Sitodiplosis mosellana TaxID=263140 RepID=UPI0024446C85|nr:probable 39S ribosomal protein L45, mitochondrial [Sitodiplosis mosellana]
MAAITLFTRVSTGLKVQTGVLYQCLNLPLNYQSSRNHSKHWNPKFKWLRAKKFVKVDLPNFHENEHALSEDEKKRKMKERGIMPARPWSERPIILSATSNIFEPYVPPEGDGKLSKFTAGGAKQTYEFLEKKSKSMMAVRKIRAYEEDFSPKTFGETAQDIYIRTHEALMGNDESAIRENVTERLYPEIKHNTKNVTIRWKFLGSIEPPRVVHARQTHLISKENIFAQITVRMHTQQSLAIYDRFGRLMHGSEILAKDVLEYVVFEKNISNLYGEWRMHAKIIPPWNESKQPSPTTYRVINVEDSDEILDEPNQNQEDQEQAIEAVQMENEGSATKPLSPSPVATA